MRRVAACLILLAVIPLGAPRAARAQPPSSCELMVDASGSMAGYYGAESRGFRPDAAGSRLRPLLERLRGLCGRTWMFDLRPSALAPGAPFAAGHKDTDIGHSLAEWARGASDGAFLILVTDNVDDPGTGAANSNARFYDLLRRRDSDFSHVSVLALRAPFDGNLYRSGRGQPGIVYQGPRALTLYVLGKKAQGQDEAYRAIRRAIEGELARSGRVEGDGDADYGTYVLFDVRPFATETLGVKARDVEVIASRRGGSRCARTHFDSKTGTFYLLDQKMGQRCDVTALLSLRIPRRWCLNNTSLRAVPRLDTSDPALREGATATVTPPRANLCSAEQQLHTTLSFNPIEYEGGVGFFEKLRRSFMATFKAEGDVRIVGSLARGDVALGDEVTRAWSFDEPAGIASPDAAMQRRVFQLDSAVRSVVPEEELELNELVSYKVHIRGRYVQGPVLAIIAVVLLLLLLLGLLVLLARKPRTLGVTGEDGAETILRLRLFGGGRVPAGVGDLHLDLTNLGLALLARSNGRISRGRLLAPGGGRVVIGPRGARARPRRPAAAAADSFDAYDGYQPDSGAGAGTAVTFSIRSISANQRRREETHDEGF